MNDRCRRESHRDYKYYGGRGIIVCDEWRDFSSFKNWAINNGYKEDSSRSECTIDRIDVNGNYCPDNCRWVDMKIQNNNSRRNRNISFNGKSQTVAQWADEIGVPYKTLFKRLKDGWGIERALTTQLQRKVKK